MQELSALYFLYLIETWTVGNVAQPLERGSIERLAAINLSFWARRPEAAPYSMNAARFFSVEVKPVR